MGKGNLKAALQLAGDQHNYQKILLVFISIIWVERFYINLTAPYLYMDPQFNCLSKNHPVHQKQACHIISECQPKVDTYNLTYELGLYCHHEWVRLLIQAIFPIGSFAGLMFINLISDTKGRRLALLIDLSISSLGVLLSIMGGNLHNYYFSIVAQFLLGFGGYSMISLGYTILADYFSDHLRQIGIVVISAFGGFAVLTVGFFYIIKLNWLYYLVCFQLIPLVSTLGLIYYFFYESPFVLMNHNSRMQAQQVLVKIALFNHKKQNVQQIRRIIQEQQRDHTHKPTLHKIFKMVKQWRFLKSIIILTALNSIGNLNYFGMTYSFSQQGLGFGYNSIIFGLVQVFSYVFTRYTVRNIKRRDGIGLFYCLMFLINMLNFLEFVQESSFISSLLIAINRIFALNAYCLIVCMQTQSFSVYIQSTAAGLVEGFSLIGALFAPIVVQAANYFQIDPIGFIGLFMPIIILFTYFLDQTFHKPPILDEPKSSIAHGTSMIDAKISRKQSLHMNSSKQIQMTRFNSKLSIQQQKHLSQITPSYSVPLIQQKSSKKKLTSFYPDLQEFHKANYIDYLNYQSKRINRSKKQTN